MDLAARLMVPVVVGLTGLVGAIPGSTGPDENRLRLEAMPRERRLALSEALERFDKLPTAEQAAIRRIDAELAAQDPVDRARYREVLRRYRLWVGGLTDDQRRKLEEATGDEARFNLALQFRAAEKSKKPYPGPRIGGIRTGELGLIGPYEAAHLLAIWQKLPEADRLDLDRRQGPRIRGEILSKGRALNLHVERFPPSDEEHYDQILDHDPNFKTQLGPWAVRAAFKVAKKAGDAAKKTENTPKRFPATYLELRSFEDHPVIPVQPENLAKFAAWCPAWLMATVDPLSSDDARHYLTILYRLLYPIPREFEVPPVPKPNALSPAKAGPKPPARPPL